MVVKSVHQWHLAKKDSVMSELPMAECGSNPSFRGIGFEVVWKNDYSVTKLLNIAK